LWINNGHEQVIHTTYGYTLGNPQNPSDMADIPKVIEKVKGNCAGSIYLTEDPSPGKLSSYWDQ